MTYDLDAFDEAALEMMKNMMKDKFPIMVEGYLEDATTYINHIKDGLANDNKESVSQYAHPLKSSSLSLGAVTVSKIAQDMEYGAKDAIANSTDINHLKDLMAPLEEALDKAQSKLKSYL